MPCTDFREPCTDFREPCMDFREPCTEFREPCTEFREPCTEFREPCTEFREPCTEFREPVTPALGSYGSEKLSNRVVFYGESAGDVHCCVAPHIFYENGEQNFGYFKSVFVLLENGMSGIV